MPKNPSKFNKFKIFFILCYKALKPFSTQNNQKANHGINTVNNLSFSVYKITKAQINIFSSGWPILDRLSFCFFNEYHTLRIPQQKETLIGMFALSEVILNRVDL